MKSFVFLAFFVSSLAFSADWPANTSAVKWETKKTMFLFKDETPQGVNSSLFIEKIVSNEQVFLQITIPLNKFNSGDEGRDQEVFKILGGEKQPNLIFTSNGLSQEDFDKTLKGEINSIAGSIRINSKAFPVKLDLLHNENFLEGTMNTDFGAFSLEAPSVAGGIVSKVTDKLKLSGRIYFKDIN